MFYSYGVLAAKPNKQLWKLRFIPAEDPLLVGTIIELNKISVVSLRTPQPHSK